MSQELATGNARVGPCAADAVSLFSPPSKSWGTEEPRRFQFGAGFDFVARVILNIRAIRNFWNFRGLPVYERTRARSAVRRRVVPEARSAPLGRMDVAHVRLALCFRSFSRFSHQRHARRGSAHR